jgi:site-specific DNA-methyltransferase (adenine-specific)
LVTVCLLIDWDSDFAVCRKGNGWGRDLHPSAVQIRDFARTLCGIAAPLPLAARQSSDTQIEAFEGRPQDLAAAMDLAARDKHQFELWALSVVEAQPWKGGRKGADTGIDGIIYFKPDGKRTEKAIVEVKGGAVGVKDIGRLAQVMERERAVFGVYITARPPTRAMESDAAAVGVWENEYTGRKHPRLQILTLAELFQNKRPDIPWVDASVLKSAKREDTSQQGKLL